MFMDLIKDMILLFPNLRKNINENKTIKIFGTGNQIRSFLPYLMTQQKQ